MRDFRRTRRDWGWAVTGLVLGLLAPWSATAQEKEKPDKPAKPPEQSQPQEKPRETKPEPQSVAIKEPAPYRVYQRDRDGRADIAVLLDVKGEHVKSVAATVSNPQGGGGTEPVKFEDGKLVGVPTGGPYTISVSVHRDSGGMQSESVDNVFVGDLWVLAGQSNMEGVADLVDVAPPDPQVSLLGMDGKWSQAEEPLHWLVDSPDPVHSGDPETREKRSAETHKKRTKGAGLGLSFASKMAQATNVPVGLVACAHGGTSMAQWDPAKKGEGGKSLYGSMLRQVKLAGGRVKGALWYQGESDANPKAAETFPKAFTDFIAAVRSDFEQPELPFYFVQIGRVVRGGDPKAWNAVQDAQRRIAERVPNTAVVSVVDLELDDGIHVGTQGQKRVGHRLASIALRELFGQVGATTPTFDRVNKGAGNTLVVKFKGVNIAQGRPVGGMGGMGGGIGGGMGAGMGGGMGGTGGGFRQIGIGGGSVGGFGGGGTGMGGVAIGAGPGVVGLKPQRHIAGFSIRKEDGTEIPMIYDAAVGKARDSVILKLHGALPDKDKTFLWYGYGFDPYCNLTDALDMAVPVFGPIALDDVN